MLGWHHRSHMEGFYVLLLIMFLLFPSIVLDLAVTLFTSWNPKVVCRLRNFPHLARRWQDEWIFLVNYPFKYISPPSICRVLETERFEHAFCICQKLHSEVFIFTIFCYAVFKHTSHSDIRLHNYAAAVSAVLWSPPPLFFAVKISEAKINWIWAQQVFMLLAKK